MSTSGIKEVVKEKYGEAARRVLAGEKSSCCGASACGTEVDPITKDLYDSSQTCAVPEEALKASLGCGNPTALAQLIPERWSSILDRAAVSMCCSQRSAWDQPAKPTASI